MGKEILILGGTGPLGRNVTDFFLKKGYNVYLFNRGLHTLTQNSDAKLIIGNRQNLNDLSKLKSISPDYVIDTLGWFPETLNEIINIFSNKIKGYIFISSASVYPGSSDRFFNEETPITSVNPTWANIGLQKKHCEEILKSAENSFPVVILRLSHLLGVPGTLSRETFLTKEILMGHRVYIPDDGNAKLQFISCSQTAEVCFEIISKMLFLERYNIFNLTSAKCWTIKEWIKQFAQWLNLDVKYEFMEYSSQTKNRFIYQPGNVMMDNRKIEKILGYKLKSPDKSDIEVYIDEKGIADLSPVT